MPSDSLRTIYGNYIGSRADTSTMLQFAAEHGIAAVVEVMPFSRINDAIPRVRSRDVPMGLVLENRE
jgi:D-arabinose 1-dehydrogenase-like Zn-dependent alcohol dehydrogenase